MDGEEGREEGVKTVMLLGATGLVGSLALHQLLAAPAAASVIAPTRRALSAAPKLKNPVLPDLLALQEMDVWRSVDAIICALGTTRQKAGSKEAFQRMDRDLPLALAGKARQTGISTFCLVSSAGANPRSMFLYPRTKGEIEQALVALNFPSLTIIRPGFISGDRQEARLMERSVGTVLGWLAPLLPAGARPSRANVIATALVQRALRPRPGLHVIRSNELAFENASF